MESVLVTGGAGYIGSHVVLALKEAGYHPVIIDDCSTGFAESIASDIPFIQASCGDAEALSALFRQYAVTAVMHMAGSIVVPESVTNPLKYYQNNVSNSIALFAAMQSRGVKHLVFSSTAAVYGIPEQIPITESTPTLPINPYGMSKLMVEQIIHDTSRATGLHAIALRYFNVAGADPHGRTGQRSKQATHLIKIVSEVAVGKRPSLAIFGTDYPTHDGSCIRDYIHVSDLASAHVQALRYLEQGGSNAILNCGYGQGYSVLEIIAMAEKILGKSLPIYHAPRRAGDPPILVAKTDQIQRILSFRPSHASLEEIITTAISWEEKLLQLA